MAILLFVLALFILILVHEFGHFITAKRVGMRVDEFGIGFPPRLFGVRRGETLYSFNALLLGGFVRIFGENGDEGAANPRAFSQKSKKAQAIVLVAGITANVIFAWALFGAAHLNGIETAVDEASASDSAELAMLSIVPESPAERVGFLPNDRILGIRNLTSGEMLTDALTPASVADFIAKSEAQAIEITYRRDGVEDRTTLTPEGGIAIETEDAADRARIGVFMGLVETVRSPLHIALYRGLFDTARGLRDITLGIITLVKDALIFEADLKNIAGPVGIAVLAGDASAFGASAFLIFVAYISLNLAVINLLPLPALDGGRLVMVAVEAIRGKSIAPRVTGLLNTVGFALLIALMLAVTYNDLARIF